MHEFKFQDTSLPVDERVNALLKELTLDEKILLISSNQQAIPRLGINACSIGTEAARGLVCRGDFGEAPTTVFPEPFGLAASFDPDLMHEIGVITGNEARIYNKEGSLRSFCGHLLSILNVIRAGDAPRRVTVRIRSLPVLCRWRIQKECTVRIKSMPVLFPR